MKHYAMMRESSFARAAGLAHGIGGPAGGPDLGDSSHSEAIEAERDAGPKMKKTQVKPGFGDSCHPVASCGETIDFGSNGRGGTRTPDIHFVRVAL